MCLYMMFISPSSRTEALGTHLCPHLAWLRQCWRSSSCCILSVTSPLSVTRAVSSVAKSNIVKAVLFTQDIVQPDTFRKTYYAVSSPFITAERWWLGKHKKMGQKASSASATKCFRSLIDLLNSYLMASSVVGFYSLRVFEGLTPRKDDTTMTTVKTEWKDREWGEVGPRVLKLFLRCWCVWATPVHLPPNACLPLCSELQLLTNVFLWASQWL